MIFSHREKGNAKTSSRTNRKTTRFEKTRSKRLKKQTLTVGEDVRERKT